MPWRAVRLLVVLTLPASFSGEDLRVGHLESVGADEARILGLCRRHSEDHLELALRWHKLYLSSAPLATMEKESTTVALKPHSIPATVSVIYSVSKRLLAVRIAIIHSPGRKQLARKIAEILKNTPQLDVSIVAESDGVRNCNAIFTRTRVVLSLLDFDHLVSFTSTWMNEATRPLEFLVVQLGYRQLHLNASEFYFNLWHSVSGTDKIKNRLRRLHRNVLFVYIMFTTIHQNLKLFAEKTDFRLPYYKLYNFADNETQLLADVAPQEDTNCTEGFAEHFCYNFEETSQWEEAMSRLPPAIPECGYSGEFCSDRHVFAIVAIVFAVLLIFICVAFYLHRKEDKLYQMPWRVPLESLTFTQTNDNPGYRRVSTASVSRCSLTGPIPTRAEFGYVRKTKVSLKRFIQKRAISFSREEMALLNEINYINQPNINVFCGICFNQDSELSVMWNYTVRYSLEDIIFSKGQKFGRNFQSTFLKHILNGLNFIHNSSIKFHGALYLSNCVVDSYWVVKLTDFGVMQVLRDKILQKELHRLQPIDIEYLESKYLLIPPERIPDFLELREEPPGSVEGDIYQLGMVIFQILFSIKPFNELSEPIRETLEKICSEKGLQPCLPECGNFTVRLVSVMQQCWLQRISGRPALFKISDAVAREFEKDLKGTLIDQMIEMVDEYSANLEQVVATRTRELDQQMSQTENLLYQLLPKSIADALREGRPTYPEQHHSVSLLVADLCQFTTFCEALIPIHVLETLQELYSSFDMVVQRHNAFKVENVGDAYLIGSGIPHIGELKHLREVGRVALKLRKFMETFVVRHRPEMKLQLKLGISSGVVATGVLGSVAPRFCVFGEAVSLACQMASHSLPGKIQLPELTTSLLKENYPAFQLEERGMIEVKGKGMCLTFWLIEELRVDRQPSSCSILAKNKFN
ncbi:unnamed protein product [Caenorhabditis auriculariae]|uniref:guanylate cyclase n=1 Tax=Caenorhabditis auriculariae TaxID=2777116 RepID=A0A8S1HGV9_9PELO|nr:unnamed protein product [Caenorhabditis auriculariae]